MRIFIIFALCFFAQASCPPRQSTMECFYKKADKNNDGVVTRSELSKTVYGALRWYEKVPFRIFGGINRIMNDCDANKNNELTVVESLSMKYCMDSCFKRSHTKNKFQC